MIIQFLRILSIAALITDAARAAPAAAPLPSVVMLSAPDGACGTGVLLSAGRILTNTHVAATLCPTFHCRDITVEASSAPGETARHAYGYSELYIEQNLGVFDLAVLRLDPAPTTSGVLNIAEKITAAGSRISLLGFPSCEALTVSQGAVEQAGILHLYTTAAGTFGSSGSAILNESNELVGIADESSSVPDALLALAVGHKFALRGVNVVALRELLAKSGEDLINAELRLLLQYYLAEVMPRSDMARYRLGFGFLTMVEDLKSDLAQQRAPVRYSAPFLAANSHVHKFLSLPFAEIAPEALLVALARIREDDGFLAEGFRPVTTQQIRQVIGPYLTGDNSSQFERLLGGPRPIGITYRAAFLGAWIAAAILLIAILWAFSVSQVYFRTRGGLLRRLLAAAAVGVCVWPISWIAWLARRTRAAKYAALPLLLLLTSCDSSGGVPPGRIRFKNDMSGAEYSTVNLSVGGRSITLKAGEWSLLPSGTTQISISYQGARELRRYRVECPSKLTEGISIRLIDVHSNRIAGGCTTVWAKRE